MAFKKVGNGNFKYLKYNQCKEGQVLAEGTYLGHQQGKYGIQHQIRTNDANNDITVLNSSGQLNFILANHVSKGDFIQVLYKGMITLTKGDMVGKDSHQFEVLVDEERGNDKSAKTADASEDDDDDDTSSAPAPKKYQAPAEADADDDDDDDDDGEEEEEEEEVPEVKPKSKKEEAPAPEKKKMSSAELLAKYGKKG